MTRPILASSGETLRGILAQSKQLSQMQQVIDHVIDNELRPHCKVASFRNGCLKIVAPSAVWATRLRYCIPELLSALRSRKAWQNLTRIECKIALAHASAKHPPKRPYLSPNAKEAIRDVADGIQDTDLRDALERLATNAE